MWYDKLLKSNYKVRGTIDIATNSFPKEKNYKYEMEKSEYKRDLSVEKPKNASDKWIAPRIPIKDEDGRHKYSMDYIYRDAYIECNGGIKIFCVTADDYNCRSHIYEAFIPSYGKAMNIFREYYKSLTGGYNRIQIDYVDTNGEKATKWDNDYMVEYLQTCGDIFDFTEGDGEVYFKSKNIQLLCDILVAKKVKKIRNPFDDYYLDWSNNNFAIPEEELEKVKFESHEFGSVESMTYAKKILEITNKFMDDNNITSELKKKYKIKDNKKIIYKLGLWNNYVVELAREF